jgi:hypothetical protein
MSKKEEIVLLYGVSSLIDLDHATWPFQMTSSALNLYVGQQLKYQPNVGKLEALV